METLATLRIMFITRDNRGIAPLLGFIEVFLWVVVISQILQNLDNIFCYIAYAGGFAMGSYVGSKIEGKLALGNVMINVMTRKRTIKLQKALKENGYGSTKLCGRNTDGVSNIIYIIAKRKELQNVIKIIHDFNPNAFFTVENISKVNEGAYPLKNTTAYRPELGGRMKWLHRAV